MHSRNKIHIRKSHRKSHRKQHNKHHTKSQNKKNRLSQRLSRKKKNSHTRKHTRNQRGGFNNCSLATVQEQGFTIPAIGDIPGFKLSESKGAIYRPNCKTDSYQAMTPT